MEIFNKDVSVLGELTLVPLDATGKVLTLDATNIVRYRNISDLANDGADKTYIHDQGVASDTWTISHGLNKFPSVVAIDSVNRVCIGSVEYTDNNNIIITFNAVFSGKAYLN